MTFKSDFLPKPFYDSVTEMVVKLLPDQCQTRMVIRAPSGMWHCLLTPVDAFVPELVAFF